MRHKNETFFHGFGARPHVVLIKDYASIHRLRAVVPTTKVCDAVCKFCCNYGIGKHQIIELR